MQSEIKKRVQAFANQIRMRQRQDIKDDIRTSHLIEGMSNTIMGVCDVLKNQIKEELIKEFQLRQRYVKTQTKLFNKQNGEFSQQIQKGLCFHERVQKIQSELLALQNKNEFNAHSEQLEDFGLQIERKILQKVEHNYATSEQVDVVIQKLKYLGEKYETMVEDMRGFSIPTYPLSQVKQITPKTFLASKWVDPESTNYLSLIFDSSKIKANFKDLLVFSKERIRGKYSYTVKIIRMNRTMSIGIASQSYKKRAFMQAEQNLIVYWNQGNSWNGRQWRQKVGRPFHQKDEIEVNIDFNMGLLTWKTSGNLLFRTNITGLDRDVVWVPFIYLSSLDDQISISQKS